MFDISWSELLIVGVVALIAIGPKELPGVLRAVGQWMGKIRRMASDFQDQFREAMREAEVADLKRQFEEASAKATSAFDNPLEVAQKEVEAAFGAESAPADKTAGAPALATTDPGAIAPPASEPDRPVTPEAAVAAADAPAGIKPDSTRPGGSGAP
jgi:sec-independent protein translocase protein TatB